MVNKITEIQQIVSRETGVEIAKLQANSRKANIIVARHLSMYFCRWYSEQSLLKISAAHGKGTHGTVINACSSVTAQRKNNSKFRELYETIASQVKQIK
jgi:chromosomal replication initiator protein